MPLEQTINDDLKAAMKAGDALRRDTLRMLIAAMKNERIERGSDLDEAGVMAVVRRGVKSRKDSAEQYRAADRLDLAEKEDAEIAVLEGYLPQMLDEAATAAIVWGGRGKKRRQKTKNFVPSDDHSLETRVSPSHLTPQNWGSFRRRRISPRLSKF